MSLLPKRKPIEIKFSDLAYDVQTGKRKETKTILHYVSGTFHPGKLTAIMGPSGAGKTTLMNIIAGYKVRNVKGTILANGRERIVHNFRRMACYIMQEDHHHPHLTVAEAMNVAANLKLWKMPSSKKQDVIREILITLSLIDHSKTRTCNLSGGQRKRLSIALELVNNPPVMFFDEPTSGLDSQNSFQCINLLNSLGKEGRTIICTIHQPSARLFEKFDFLYSLSEGQCIYRGAVSSLLPYLSSMELECPSYHNPADFLIEVASSGEYAEKLASAVIAGKCNSLDEVIDEIDALNDFRFKSDDKSTFLYESTPEVQIPIFDGSEGIEGEDNNFAASELVQLGILLKRNYVSILRDSMLTKLRLLSHIVVGILIGTLYYGIGDEASRVFSNIGFLFCCVLFTIFAGMMPTLLTFPIEMKVFVREHHNCLYSLKSYYLAKTLADIPFQIIYPVLYVLIVYFLSNQPHDLERFCMFTLICVLTSFVAQSLALVIGAAMEIQEATFFAPVVSIPILLFSGYFVRFRTIPTYVRWLTYASYMKYGFEGALLSIYDFDREKLQCAEPYCHLRSPLKILKSLELNVNNYWIDVLALIGFFLALRIIGYFVLKWKLKKER